MRSFGLMTFAAFVLLSGCSSPPRIERLELRLSGQESVDLSVDSQGKGTVRGSALPETSKGTFTITPNEYVALVKRLEPFRRQAAPYNSASIVAFMGRGCPGNQFQFHRGAVWVRWTGPRLDQHFIADLGCEVVRNEARNAELLRIVRSLPVHLGIWGP